MEGCVTKFIALIGVVVLMALSGLGNFWFTYGIWPRSWVSYVAFSTIGLVLTSAFKSVLSDGK
jgi:hypothetical protein